MKRLTKRLPDGKMVAVCDSCEREKDKQCTFFECRASLIKRLAAYEDTGLEPEEVETIKLALAAKHFADLETLNNTQISRLVELAVADKAGRVMIVPCETGDTVWRLQFVDKGNGIVPIEPVEARFNLLMLPEFGRTIFLTREEAEKALEARKYG